MTSCFSDENYCEPIFNLVQAYEQGANNCGGHCKDIRSLLGLKTHVKKHSELLF